MNAKNLSMLTFLTLVIAVMALWLSQPPMVLEKNKPVFPKLMDTINEVTAINVTTKNDNFTVERNGELWVLKEKFNYPVAIDKVRSTLLGLTDLTTVEAKTATPSLYSKLGVEEVTAEDSKSTLLSLKNKDGKTVASIILGNFQPAKSDTTLNEIYVRKAGEPQAWLTQGFLRIERMPMDWVEKRILDLESKRLRQVSITQPGDHSLVIFKAQPEETNYQLKDLPAGAHVKAPYELGQIANVLSALNINEVTAETEVKFAEDSTYRAVFTSFDGLEVTMTAMEKEGKYYAKFAATVVAAVMPPAKSDTAAVQESKAKAGKEEGKESENKDAKDKKSKEEDKTGLKTVAEVKTEVELLMPKLSGWVFEIPKYKMEPLLKKSSDLISTGEDDQKESLNPNQSKTPSPLLEFGTPKT